MISHPYELLVYGRDGRIQSREFATISTALAAAQALKPSMTLGWRLSLVVEVHSFPRNEHNKREALWCGSLQR